MDRCQSVNVNDSDIDNFDADIDYLTHVNVTVFLQKLLLLNVNIFTYINTFLPLWDNFANKKQSELAVTIPKNTTKITIIALH